MFNRHFQLIKIEYHKKNDRSLKMLILQG
jgi:hypothetical protein